MLKKVSLTLHFPITNQAQMEQLRDAVLPLFLHAVVVNEGQPNEERGFIELEDCLHDEGGSCTLIARWEVGRGRVI